MSTSWTVAIDWDRDGEFSGEHDDITQRVQLAEWFVGMQSPYQLTAEGSTLMMRLNNVVKLSARVPVLCARKATKNSCASVRV